jgi:hypothetical protein
MPPRSLRTLLVLLLATTADLAAAPSFVPEFLATVPTAWDETRIVEGFPGDYAVLARRKGTTWYVAGISGRPEAQAVRLDLPGWLGTLIADGDGPRNLL